MSSYICIPGYDVLDDSPPERPQASTYRNPADWFVESLTGALSRQTVVNSQTILTHAPVWRAVNLLSGDLGQLPVHVMRRLPDGGAEKDRNQPGSKLLRIQPNDWQTPSVYKEQVMYYSLVYGNSISWIERDRGGQPISLIPWHPDYVVPQFDWDTMQLRFEIYDQNRQLITILDNRDAIHLSGLRSDGLWGFSLMDVARAEIGLGMQLREHGTAFFENGAQPGGVLEHPSRLDAEARANLKAEWNKVHQGAKQSGKIAVLWEGMQYKTIPISNDDSEWLDSRRFDRETVANIFGIPAFKLNSLENSAVRSNLEEQNRDYYQTALSRWTNRLAEEFDRKLLTPGQRQAESHYFRWFPEAFLRGDTKSRFESYSLAITSEFMSPNEVRAREDMNPYEGGDEFRNPAINPSQDDTTEPDNTAPANSVYRDLIMDRATHLVSAECRSVKQAAKSRKNFVNWVDAFYASKFLPMADDILGLTVQACAASGVDCRDLLDVAVTHADQSRNDLLQIAGASHQSNLAANAAALVEGWPDRAKSLTHQLMGS